ncbi:MAG: hypothetical protein ACJAVD_001484 [Porticoccaceae bacterium]|jgi:hypothetical protein
MVNAIISIDSKVKKTVILTQFFHGSIDKLASYQISNYN